ncbi:hypothetical protein F2P79_016704, partial [Pimephales promelas]
MLARSEQVQYSFRRMIGVTVASLGSWLSVRVDPHLVFVRLPSAVGAASVLSLRALIGCDLCWRASTRTSGFRVITTSLPSAFVVLRTLVWECSSKNQTEQSVCYSIINNQAFGLMLWSVHT